MPKINKLFGSKITWLFLATILIISNLLTVHAQIKDPNSSTAANSTIYLPNIRSYPAPVVVAGTFYLSPSGDDTKSGKTPAEAWKTFDRAIDSTTPGTKLKPGETLVLLDGTYYQSLKPHYVSGQSGKPITIMAQNDGKAIIDGQNVRVPVLLEEWRNASYYVIKGIVAKNSSGAVFMITADNNTFQRVSGYNANTDANQHVFIIWANNTLVEDCIASGSGRKMILVFASDDSTGQHNTIRRCFASFHEWDGKKWHDEWPWNENYEAYSGDYNIFENDIAYGYFANAGFSLLSNGPTDNNIGNQILGSIAINGGRDFEGNTINWGNIRPQPSQYGLLKDITNPSHRVGFSIGHDGIIKDNLLQDVLAYGGAGLGIRVDDVQPLTNVRINRATIMSNGLDLSYGSGGTGIDGFQEDLNRLIITNSRIDKIKISTYPYSTRTPITGEGARLQNRYINGVLKDGTDGSPAQPLWPWPMEDRVRSEMGISVTNLVSNVTHQAQLANPVAPMNDTSNIFPNHYLSVTPTYNPFGNKKLGTTASQPVTLKNLGDQVITVSGYQFDSAGSSRFSIIPGGSCPQIPFTLGAGQSCTITVGFAPQDYQVQSTYLTILSPDAATYPKLPRIYLSGLGYSSTSANPLPAKLQAEAFTISSGNFQVKPTMDDGGSAKIAGAESGVWLTIPVNIAQAGNYGITARVASINNGSNSVHFTLDLDGTPLATFYPPSTGDWENFTDVTISNIPLPQGNHTLRISYTTGGFDLNYIQFFPL